MTDRSADARRFDPRFDPAFQPGYDPRNDPARAARAVPHRFDVEPSEQFPSSQPPVLHPSPPRPSTTGVPRTSSPVVGQQAPAEELPEHERSDQPDAAPAAVRGSNPFTIVLWVISVLLIAGGIAVFRAIPGFELQTSSGSTDTAVTFTQLLALSALAAGLISVGLTTAIGNLFLLAIRWRPRAGATRD